MRTDLVETTPKLQSHRARRETSRAKVALEPTAVDAALADESMPMVTERASRLDPAVPSTPSMRSNSADAASDPALLESLAHQLDLLHRQQRQIERLLDRAGRVRLDAANS